jgi:hypothetical protein
MTPRQLSLFSSVLLLCLLCTLQCAPAGKHVTAPLAAATALVESDLYQPALEKARAQSQADGLAGALRVESKVSLDGGQVKNLNQFRVASNGDIYVVDYERKQAEAYDRSGHYLGALGARGNQPGAHLWPSDVAEASDQTIAVSDFQTHRVNTFARDGKLLSSFIYTPQSFSAQRMLYDEVSHSFYLFGNRWQRDSEAQIVGAELVHKYSADGEFIASYLPFPDSAKSLDLYSYDYPSVDAAKGSLFIALPFEYTIYRLTPDGQLSTFLKAEEPSFRAPGKAVDVEKIPPAESYRRIQNWRLSWTPINALVVSGDDLLVQYQSFNPLRYTIDIWSLAKKKKLKSLNTNCAILTKGQDGYIYFLENVEAKGQERYDILRAKLKTL